MRSKRIANQEALIQAETQSVPIGLMANGFYEKGKENNDMNRRYEFLWILLSKGRNFYRGT